MTTRFTLGNQTSMKHGIIGAFGALTVRRLGGNTDMKTYRVIKFFIKSYFMFYKVERRAGRSVLASVIHGSRIAFYLAYGLPKTLRKLAKKVKR